MARMSTSARSKEFDDADILSHKTLFQYFIPRYLRIPAVRQWLMDRTQTATRYASKLDASLSYACMYYPPTATPRNGGAPYPIPTPFLDYGDFMLCEHVYDGIAVGTLFNQRDEHALAVLRDKMLPNSTLSRRVRTRRFAVDLSVSNLEIIEFAWMDDDSLVIACRRLDQPISRGVNIDDLVLSGDFLFYHVIPPDGAPDVPLLRMTLCEKPAICQFCGARGIKTCACPPAFKTRAPTTHSVPVPFSHAPFSDNTLSIVPQGPLAGMLATWENYTKRIFSINTAGSFFIHWYKRSKKSDGMTLFMSPRHPVPYNFSCGTKSQTMALASMYVKRMKLCERAYSADARLYDFLSRGSNLNMLIDKEESWPLSDDPLGDYTNSSPDFTSDSLLSLDDEEAVIVPDSPYDESGPPSVVDSACTDPTAEMVPSEEYIPYVPTTPAIIQELDPISSVTSATSRDSSGLSSGDHTSQNSGQNCHFDSRTNAVQQNRTCASAQDGPRHVMDGVFDAWGAEGHGTPGSAPTTASKGQRLTLSTTSRELQQYMTVDASNTPTCKECGSSFPKRGNLARHIQTVHLKLKPFQCEHCHASFGYKNHLKRHQIVHQRGGEFKCKVCNREFKGQLQLTRHIQQSHQSSTSEPGMVPGAEESERTRVSCDICGGKLTYSCHFRNLRREAGATACYIYLA